MGKHVWGLVEGDSLHHMALIRIVTFHINLVFSTLAMAEAAEDPLKLLFNVQSTDEFQSAIQAAKTQGNIAPQVLLEARFIHLIDQHDYDGLGQLSKELTPLYEKFDGALSQVFTLEDDWKAIVHFTQAFEARTQQQDEAFKRHMQQAFWLSPRQAPVLAPHIERFKLNRAMQNLKISLSSKLPKLEQPETLNAIGSIDAPAQLIFFWSPWSQEWIEHLDEWKMFCDDAKQGGIFSTCILGELNPEILVDAVDTMNEFELHEHARWLIESPDLELSRKLMIQTIPTAVLIKSDGSILYNGTPGTTELHQLIQQFKAVSSD